MQLHYLKVMSENSVKEMEAFQENLQKRDPEIKEIVQRISDQNARRKNSSLSLKHETGLVDMSDMVRLGTTLCYNVYGISKYSCCSVIPDVHTAPVIPSSFPCSRFPCS